MIEVFGKSRAGMRQHDMANLFHELLINVNNSLSFIYHFGGCPVWPKRNTKNANCVYCSFFCFLKNSLLEGAIVKPALHCAYPSKAKTWTKNGANGSSRKRRSDWHYWRSYGTSSMRFSSRNRSACRHSNYACRCRTTPRPGKRIQQRLGTRLGRRSARLCHF